MLTSCRQGDSWCCLGGACYHRGIPPSVCGQSRAQSVPRHCKNINTNRASPIAKAVEKKRRAACACSIPPGAQHDTTRGDRFLRAESRHVLARRTRRRIFPCVHRVHVVRWRASSLPPVISKSFDKLSETTAIPGLSEVDPAGGCAGFFVWR